MKYLLLLVIPVFLTGCSISERDAKRNDELWTSQMELRQKCIDAGGIPVMSAWNGNMYKCNPITPTKQT